MRFGFAISALVLSGILLILGIGQSTFLAGPAEIRQEVELSAVSGLAVIPAEALQGEAGQPNIVVQGQNALVATATTVDLQAWIAPFAHTEITYSADSQQFKSAIVAADSTALEAYRAANKLEADEEVPVADYFGSDLWQSAIGEPEAETETAAESDAESTDVETSVSGATAAEIRLPVQLSQAQQVLIAVEAGSAGEATAGIVWVQDTRTPWAGPLLTAGALFAVAGLVLYLIAVDHDRRGLGPRRGRKGPFIGIRDSLTGRRLRKPTPLAEAIPASEAEPPNSSSGEVTEAEVTETDAPETKVTETEAAQQTEGQVGETSESAVPAGQDHTSKDDANGKQMITSVAQRRTARKFALPAIGITLALGLSGCSANAWPDFSADSTQESDVETSGSNIAPVPVTQNQIDRVITDLVALSNASDESLDAGPLSARFTGDALNQRVTNYKIRKEISDYEIVIPSITDNQLGYQLVQSTEAWPRTLFVTLASSPLAEITAEAEADTTSELPEEADTTEDTAAAEAEPTPSLALVIKQMTPYENYKVTRIFSLRGGITMPEAAPAEDGTALLPNNLATLVLSPNEVGSTYAAVLAGTANDEQKALFNLEEDPLIERVGAAWVKKAQESADAAGQTVKYSVSIKPSDLAPTSLSTGTGGGLVALSLTEQRIGDSEGTRFGPTAVGAVTALSGLTGRQDKLVQVVTDQLLFYVPTMESGEPIQLLGFSSDLVAARNS